MRLALIASFALAGLAAADPPPGAAVEFEKHIRKVIEDAEPSVACVLVSKSEHYADFGQGPSSARDGRLGDFRTTFVGRGNPGQRELVKRLDLSHPDTVPDKYGSGVVIEGEKGERVILTTFHVIEGATKIYVRLPGAGRGSYADILAGDPRADLAVLKMLRPPAELNPIPFGDGGKVRKGDSVVTLDNPFAAGFRDGSPSASKGIVSNLRRRQATKVADEVRRLKPLSQYGMLLQTDARTTLGCSGGAVLNLDGQLIGLTTALAAIEGGEGSGGFAIPIDANTRKMIDVLTRGKEIEYGLLGITVNPDERGDGHGVTIQDASPGMPAARAGLLGRDVITSINDSPIREQDDLFLNISAALAGSEVKIDVLRNGVPRTFKARLVKAQQGEWVPIVSNRDQPVHGMRVDYASVQGAGAVGVDGVVVTELEPGSPAAKKLLKGMYVVAVNDQPVPTPDDFYRLAKGKGPLTLDVVDVGGETARRKVTLP